MFKRIFLLFSLPLSVYCQNVQIPNPTPSATWEFTKYGDIGVNEYRGLADINLPLYQCSENANLNLSLNYQDATQKT